MTEILSYAKLLALFGGFADRMAYIDFKLRFTGSLKRSDMQDTFGLAEAAASRMFTMYSEIRPHNFEYDRARKLNSICTDTYLPLIPIDAETALGMLVHGFNKNKLSDAPQLPYARVGNLPTPLNVEEVAKITRAMFEGNAISSRYVSFNSSNHDVRQIVPLAVISDGRNWIYRAFDRSEKEKYPFKNFNFSRSADVHILETPDARKKPYEVLEVDSKWNLVVPVLLELHQNLSDTQRESTQSHFGMAPDQTELILNERAALVWMLCKLWDVDTSGATANRNERSDSEDKAVRHFNFSLKNKDMLRPFL